jgi:small-conductance mechanosensitive channel
MTTGSHPLRTALRVLTRVVLTILGVIVALLLYLVCQGVFSGYPKYHTGLFSIIAMILVALTGGIVWIVDQRRIDADD